MMYKNSDYIDSPYYLGNCDYPPVRITVESGDKRIVQELHWDAGADEYLEAVYTAMIGMTFHPESVLEAMRDFAEERLPQEEPIDIHNEE